MAGVTYRMSAWVRASEGCAGTYIECGYQGDEFVNGETFHLDSEAADQWRQISATCTYTQAQLDAGDLYMLVGFGCPVGNNDAYVDTVGFTI